MVQQLTRVWIGGKAYDKGRVEYGGPILSSQADSGSSAKVSHYMSTLLRVLQRMCKSQRDKSKDSKEGSNVHVHSDTGDEKDAPGKLTGAVGRRERELDCSE